jgi:RHS repeat-associated protein
VIQILRIQGGLADVDSDGDEAADDGLGMTAKEREQLASLYEAGQTLWRVPIKHFSAWDFNFPFGLPSDAIAAKKALDELLGPDDAEGACKTSGSIIDCENQILGEAFPVRGGPFSLHYSSDRVPGRRTASTLKLRVLPLPKPKSLKRIDVTFSVAGQLVEQHFECTASPGCDGTTTATFAWDGKDAYGRTVQGRQPVEVRIGYAYDGVYQAAVPNGFGQAGSGAEITGSLTRQEVSLESTWHGYLGTFRVAAEGLGGLTFNVHHRYDPLSRTVYLGNGDKQTATRVPQVIALAAGGCVTNCTDTLATSVDLALPQGVAVAPDGTLYIAETNRHRILRVTPDEYVSIVAGTGMAGFQDGPVDDPTTPAQLHAPQGLALTADGALLIADTENHRVRRLKDGQLTTVAGNGALFYDASQEGGPATQAALWAPVAVAVAPDGTSFVTDRSNHQVRRIDPSQKIWLFAGTGAPGAAGDFGKAVEAAVGDPAGVAVGNDGSVYVAQSAEHRIRRIRPDGIIEPFAGTGIGTFSGDGGPATRAALNWPVGLVVGSEGSLYIADSFNHRVRRVSTDGSIQTVAGMGLLGFDGDGGPATEAKLNEPRGLALAPDGTLVVGDVQRVRRIDPASGLPGYTGVDDVVVPSEDGSRLFLFSAAGKHRETLDASTGARLLSFGYTEGLLTSITDAAHNQTQILRPSADQVEIKSPFGQRTLLSLFSSGAAQGYVHELTNPADETVTFSYGPTGRSADLLAPFTTAPSEQRAGLLTGLTDPKKQETTFHYDGEGLGRLERDDDPADGSKRLTRTEDTATKSSMAREAVLSDPTNLLSVITLTERFSVHGKAFTRAFDAASRKVTSRSPEGRETYTWLDPLGRVIGVQPKGLAKTTLQYEDKGRPWKVTAEHPTEPTLSRTYEFQYRLTDGELDRILDPDQAPIATFAYEKGRVSAITEPDGESGTRTTGYKHDDNGNLWKLTPPGKPAHTFEHTPVDLVRLYTPPAIAGVANPSTIYVPTLDRRPDVITLPSGEVLDADYDDANRLHTITTTTAGPAYALTLRYTPSNDPDPNKRGKLESILGPTSGTEIHFSYEGLLETGSTIQGVLPGGGAIALSRTFYDELRVETETVNGSTVAFTYDDDSVLWTAGALTIHRDPDHGLVTGTTLASGGHTITDSLIPTPFGEPDLYIALRDGVEIFGIDYEPFDRRGQLRKKTETIKGGTPQTFAYDYDAGRRLYAYKKNGDPATIYPYDPNGNRTGLGWGETDGQDRLPSSPVASDYTYTADGKLLTKTAAGQTTTYGSDLPGNLRTVQRPAPAALISYGVDGLNRRVSKSVGGALQRAWAYNGGRIVAEFNGAGTMTARFVYGSRPQVPDYMIEVGSGQVYRLLTDHLGSVRLVVRLSDGVIAQQLTYDPWGDVETDTKPGFQPFGFAGGLYDPETRLVRFGARDYDPAIGRWTAKDPSGFAGGTNLYAYADNDPVNLVDLTGRNPVFFMLAGAMRGIGEDILFQMTVGGKRWGCLDGEELAMAAIMGALSGGLGAPAARGAPSLPAYTGGKTSGVLRTAAGDTPLISGYKGPSAAMPRGTPGMNGNIKSHVEAHAASIMRQQGPAYHSSRGDSPGSAGVSRRTRPGLPSADNGHSLQRNARLRGGFV